MDSQIIYQKAARLVQRYKTRNPWELAQAMGIMLKPQGGMQDLLAFYTCRWQHRIIIYNDRLEDELLNEVIAHELGHDQLHRDLAKEGMQEFVLFRMRNNTEYEANAFAAHLLLDNETILEEAREGYDVAALAAMNKVDINLILIKLREMSQLGYDLNAKSLTANSDFFRKIKI